MMFSAKRLWFFSLIPVILLGAVCSVSTMNIQPTGADSVPILMIDAGHGGADGGAVAMDGTEEAAINLDISLRVAALAQFCGVPYDMTRDKADIEYPESADTLSEMKIADQHNRLNRINNLSGAILLSIHQNYYPASTPFGPQVFYGRKGDSQYLAECIQTNLTQQLSPNNRRLAAPIAEDIYLMKNASCPAVLVECGFLSNTDECARLESEGYRLQLATVLVSSYLQYIRGIEL